MSNKQRYESRTHLKKLFSHDQLKKVVQLKSKWD